MKESIRRGLRRVRKLLPSFRDLHVYGGLLLVAIGVAAYDGNAGLVVGGAILLLLGRPWR